MKTTNVAVWAFADADAEYGEKLVWAVSECDDDGNETGSRVFEYRTKNEAIESGKNIAKRINVELIFEGIV